MTKTILVCYDFHSRISDEEEDVMFATELDLFSIGTIELPIHTKSVFKLIHIIDLNIIKPVSKQLIEPICVLAISLSIYMH
jgi:hypothetical protein